MLWVLVLAALAFAGPASAQPVTSASIGGSIRDGSGAPISGARVTATQLDRNQAWTAVSDSAGRYRLASLPLGPYRVVAELDGFAPATRELTLVLGQALELPLALALAGLQEHVAVTAAAQPVEVTRTQLADRVSPREIETLPLNGRNYLDLALLVPNVTRTNTRSNDRFAETSAVPGTGITVAGQRNIGNSFIVDGLSANDDAADLAGTYYSEEVIREFQVITSGGTAEFGRSFAGTINIVTQSGTNQLRGRAYGFVRDDALDARNALATAKDPLTQGQYGVTFGGPLAKDRTFWFLNAERTQQNKTGFVTISPVNVEAVNATLGSSAYRGPLISTGGFPTGYDTFNVFGRVDHRATTDTRLELRYSVYDVGSANARGVGGLNDVSRGTRLDDTDHTGSIGVLSSLSPTVINEARAQYTRSRLGAGVNDAVGPAVSISGVASFGTSTSSPTGRNLDVVQLADTLTMQRGNHLLKGGIDLLYNRVDILFPGALQGTYSFTSLANFQRGIYQQFQQAFGTPSFAQSNPNTGLFVQDEWHPRSGVTVNAGVRYDLQWLPRPIQLDANNVSPRIGVAWAPGDRRTVVRASGGIYYDRIPLRATSNALQRDGINYRVAVMSFGQAGAPGFPAVLPSFPATLLTAITSIDTDIQNGRSHQLGLQVERALGRFASATAGYTYLRGRQIIMSRNINVPVGGIRPNPSFGNISQYQSIGESWFDGLTLSLGLREAPWGTARLSYTLSTSLDTAGNAFFQTPQDNNNIAAEKGPSDNDQRHRVVASGSLHAPAGIQIGYVFSHATGAPFNVVAGSDLNGDTNNNDRPPGVGRNSARLPNSSAFDLRISRSFRLGGSHRLETMIEAFNLFNHVNILNVNNTFGTGALPLPAFGQPTLAGDARQIQLGARWSF